MRVLHVIDGLGYGGAEKLLVTFAQQAQKQGIHTTIICLSDKWGTPVRTELEAYGATVIILKSQRLFDLKCLQEMFQIVRTGKFDVVHTHLTYANITGALIGWLAGLPVVATLHSTIVNARHSHPLRARLEFWAIRLLDKRVIAVGESVAETYQHVLRRGLDVIPNAVSIPETFTLEERVNLRTELTGDAKLLICIAVGRFSLEKGYLDLLTAFDIVRKENPAVRLIIVGDGVLRSDIEFKIVELCLESCVKLLGSRSDVPCLLNVSDLYVNASHWEGLPIAHLEAMAAGLPLVVTAVGDVPRLVHDDMGCIVPPENPAELSHAILSLLADPTRRAAMGKSARQFIFQYYSASVWFDELINLYQQAGAK
jgi:glycosyltransferase involved in cell wall biosynthesis